MSYSIVRRRPNASLLAEAVRTIGKRRFEIRQQVSCPLEDRKLHYLVETWFFFPQSLQINRWSYTATDYQQSLKNYIRLGVPIRPLESLLGGELPPPLRKLEAEEGGGEEIIELPLPEQFPDILEDCSRRLDDLLWQNTPETRECYEDSLKLFCIAFRVSLLARKNAVLAIEDGSERTRAAYDLTRLAVACLKRYRKLLGKRAKAARNLLRAPAFLYCDEYLSIITTRTLGEIVRRLSPVHKCSTYILACFGAQRAYRRSCYPESMPSKTGDNELPVFRWSVLKKYVDMLPSYDLEFFRVDTPQSPLMSDVELYDLVLNNKNRPYDMYSVLGRLFDGSQFMEYKKGYGPEMITGLAKVDGLLVGVVANQQGVFPNYPEYKVAKYGQSMAAGGKLYRQGLIKMNEFVTLCARDRLPMIWIQDTTGIDVGDDAEVAELLGLGQSLIYSIQSSKLPMMEITLRRGTAAAHYVLGGPQGNDNNAFSLGTAATEINVMNGKTAANAMYTGRLAKDQKAGKDLQPTIDKMNALIDDYDVKSRPLFCAQAGLVDEVVDMPMMRNYIVAFTDACYQNPESICPFHQMLLPRTIKDYDSLKK